MKWVNLAGLIIGSGCQAVAAQDAAMAPWLIPIGSLVLLLTRTDSLMKLFRKNDPSPPAA